MYTKAVIFDLDGVFRVGNKLIEGTKNVLSQLNSQNIKTMIVTNECRYTIDYLKDELDEMGLTIPDETLFYTAASSCRDFLERKIKRFSDEQVMIGIVGELGLYRTINELSEYPNVIIKESIDDSNIDKHKDKRMYIVVGSVNKIKIKHLDEILKWIKCGAKVIVTCPDTTDPSSKGDFNLGMPNHMLYMVGYNLLSNKYNTGKPNPILRDILMKKLSIKDPKEILFVGDTLSTDIQLAEESGFQSCLVLSGNSSKDTLKNYVFEPDFILDSVSDIFSILS